MTPNHVKNATRNLGPSYRTCSTCATDLFILYSTPHGRSKTNAAIPLDRQLCRRILANGKRQSISPGHAVVELWSLENDGVWSTGASMISTVTVERPGIRVGLPRGNHEGTTKEPRGKPTCTHHTAVTTHEESPPTRETQSRLHGPVGRATVCELDLGYARDLGPIHQACVPEHMRWSRFQRFSKLHILLTIPSSRSFATASLRPSRSLLPKAKQYPF